MASTRKLSTIAGRTSAVIAGLEAALLTVGLVQAALEGPPKDDSFLEGFWQLLWLLFMVAFYLLAVLLALLAIVMWRGSYRQSRRRGFRVASWVLIAAVTAVHLWGVVNSAMDGVLPNVALFAILPSAVGAAIWARLKSSPDP